MCGQKAMELHKEPDLTTFLLCRHLEFKRRAWVVRNYMSSCQC